MAAYNPAMRPLLPFLAALLPAAALAQAPAADNPPLEPRKNQKIERIVVEDGGSRVEELRVGGQTQQIVVQPKADVPAYEIQPTDLARSRPADHRDGMSSATGRRVWNLFSF
jgi:hypothetical protein